MEVGILGVFLQFMHYVTLPGVMALVCAVTFMAVDRKCGKAMMLSLSAAAGLNTLLKNLFGISRPWLMHPETAPFLAEGSFSFPCLHTQVTAAVLCVYALLSGKSQTRFISMAGICVTVAARLMSGVQSAADVMAGIAAGILCAVVICRVRYGGNIAAGILISGILFLMGTAAALFFDDPWGAGSALTVIFLDLLEPNFVKAAGGRTGLGKFCGTVLAIGIYTGIYVFLPFLIEWQVSPFWTGQILIVFILTAIPCLLSLFPVF